MLFQCFDEPLDWSRRVTPDTVLLTPVVVAAAHLLAGSWHEALRQSIQRRHLGVISREPRSKEAWSALNDSRNRRCIQKNGRRWKYRSNLDVLKDGIARVTPAYQDSCFFSCSAQHWKSFIRAM
jgi:hypothetical protein